MLNSPWYEKSFQMEYEILYKHRDDASAQVEIHSLIKGLNLPVEGKVLDVCCGSGRHSRVLAELGYDVTGVDLSTYLLDLAKKRDTLNRICYEQCDIRKIPFVREFDIVFNLFTSFGYFPTDEENELAIQRIARSVKPGGYVIIDYLNPDFVKAHLVPQSKRKVKEIEIEEKRWVDDYFVYKQIMYKDSYVSKEFMERVRLYSLSKMQSFLENAGISDIIPYGDYNLTPYSLDAPRMILCGKKK